MNFKRRIDTNFVSNIDRFLMDYDQSHAEKSESQKKEIKKHQKIFEKRDSVDVIALPDSPDAVHPVR